jgi:hypothetical protein
VPAVPELPAVPAVPALPALVLEPVSEALVSAGSSVSGRDPPQAATVMTNAVLTRPA